MAYLVTGGTGFIGTWVVRQLLEDGQEVVAYDIAPDRELAQQIIGKESSYETVCGDVTDLGQLIRTCQQHKVDRIIHTAALLIGESPYLVSQVNCAGTVNVLEAARILGLKRVVYCTSRSVFGPSNRYKEQYIPNDAMFYPSNVYGASKVFNELCARHYFTAWGVDSIGIRFTTVYGYLRKRGDGRGMNQGLFIDPALGLPAKVPYGETISNWLYVEDAARSLVMASKVKSTKNRVFCTSGDVRSNAEVAAFVKTLIPRADITLLPGVFRMREQYDTTLLKEEIGYQNEWPIEKAIKRVFGYLQNRKDEMERFP